MIIQKWFLSSLMNTFLQLKTGEIQIQYNDGSQMRFHPTLLIVQHKDNCGQSNR